MLPLNIRNAYIGLSVRNANPTLVAFEEHIGLGPTYAAELLGMAYSNYAQVRNFTRPLQPYTERHIEAVMLLPTLKLNALKQRHISRDYTQNSTRKKRR